MTVNCVCSVTKRQINNHKKYCTMSFQIFCVHGGIPLPSQDGGLVSSIDSIPSVLFEPEEQSELAWELMWGDPLRYILLLMFFLTKNNTKIFIEKYFIFSIPTYKYILCVTVARLVSPWVLNNSTALSSK